MKAAWLQSNHSYLCISVCVKVYIRGRKYSGSLGGLLYRTFSGIKFHFIFQVLFNLNKTLFCHAVHLMYHCIYSYPNLHCVVMCTHVCLCAHTKGPIRLCMCLKCCFYIAAIFHFGLLSFKLPMGVCMGRGAITFIYDTEGKETEMSNLFMFVFISSAFFFLTLSLYVFHSYSVLFLRVFHCLFLFLLFT